MSLRPKSFLTWICLICAGVQGQIYLQNGQFEIPDTAKETPYFTPPLDWTFYQYAGLKQEFVPEPEYGQIIGWSIPEPSEGDSFLLLSTGDVTGPGSDNTVLYSYVEQIIELCPGDTLYFSYYFGTCDYMPYNDTATVILYPYNPEQGRTPIPLITVSVQDVENYMSTQTWQHFTYHYDRPDCRQYRLYAEVRDVSDVIYQSYLALDNFRVCHNLPEFGDLNRDCKIDLQDFVILARAWLADCTDEAVMSDPSIPCGVLEAQGVTTANYQQLIDLTENWLLDFENVAP